MDKLKKFVIKLEENFKTFKKELWKVEGKFKKEA